MSIATRTGDDGTSGLMYNRRVPKTHPRIEACGTVDELNAALGLARATAEEDELRSHLLAIQLDLVDLMGEVATEGADLARYAKDGFKVVTPDLTAKLDALVREIESQNISFRGWATPGATVNAAALDLARVACRRAERRICALRESGLVENGQIGIYLNRLSDTLWLLARRAETRAAMPPGERVEAASL
jgi:cob(I)alamin adenosyltransferase